MNAIWQDSLRVQGARIDEGQVRDFGDPEGELAAACEATVIAPLTQFCLIGCTGDDARKFLHAQLTSDVNHLEATGAQYSAWCSAKGRMLASLLLFRRGAEYLALLSTDLSEFLLKRLQIYVLRSKVSLADRSADYTLLGLAGPRAAVVLENAGLTAPATVRGVAEFADGAVIRLDEQRYLILAAAIHTWQKLSAVLPPVGAPVWQWLDIQAGIPWITAATREAFVPQMLDFDRIGGVSFHKGCYPGQEVVARARYLGKVKRHLYRTRAAAPLAAGGSIFPAATPDRACGQIVSAAAAPGGGYDALAVILEDALGQCKLHAALPGDSSTELTDPVRVS